MKFRRLIRVVHRDLGYLCAGLTVIYAISGIAMNHVHDWNPNYVIENTSASIKPLDDSTATNEAIAQYVVKQLKEEGDINNFFRDSPTSIQVFMKNRTIHADIKSGDVNIETVKQRTGLHEANFLHLNKAKHVWTYVADVFAVGLALLAITGIFILPKKQGITGRGKYLVGIGILIPVIFLIIYL